MNYTATEVTHETDFLSSADVLAIERGIPRIRWNAALNQQVGRIGLLGRLSYYGPWVDYYYTRLWVDDRAPIQDDWPLQSDEAEDPGCGRSEHVLRGDRFGVVTAGTRWHGVRSDAGSGWSSWGHRPHTAGVRMLHQTTYRQPRRTCRRSTAQGVGPKPR